MRLAAFIDERRHRPFAWGEHDCCLFAADWVLALTGIDPAAALRARYDRELGAARLARECGTASHGDPWGVLEWPTYLGLAETPVSYSGRGDVAAVEHGGRMHLGVIIGRYAAAPGSDGLEFLPRRFWRRTWRVD